MIIAIQGGMAVGKTTALKIIENVYPKIAISFEDISPVVDKINKHQLDNNKLDDYCEIQQLFIQHERDRYELVRDNEIVLMDYARRTHENFLFILLCPDINFEKIPF
ncbi:hypothetical protein B8V29_03905 [Streptococcus agalactiae]|nr:hypothetical protein B8V29_03905 [Streptococcus agalactiae]